MEIDSDLERSSDLRRIAKRVIVSLFAITKLTLFLASRGNRRSFGL